MPDESCRSCGGQLIENTKCAQCMKPNSMICKKCTLCTMEQFHSICASYDDDLINAVPQIESGNYQSVVVMA